MADAYGAAVRVDPFVPEIDLQLFQTTQHLGSKSLVDLYDIHIGQRQARALQGFLRRRDRADPHHPGFDTGDCAGQNASTRGQSQFFADILVSQQQCGRAVIDAGGIAGGDYTAFKQGRQGR